MLFKIAKCGKGALGIPGAVEMLPRTLKSLGINILLVSAFPKQAEVLRRVCRERSIDPFFQDFVPFHVSLATELKMPKLFELYLPQKISEFRELFAKFLLAKDALEEEMVSASILALGEDFSQIIIGNYLKRKMRGKKNIVVRDSRNVLVSLPDCFVGSRLDQVKTRVRAHENFLSLPPNDYIWVMQASVCSVDFADSRHTSILASGDGDVSAAVLAAALDGSNFAKGQTNATSQLIYLKRFPSIWETENVLVGLVGISRIIKYMKKTGQRIVSESLVAVDGLPPVFGIVEFGNINNGIVVGAEPVILRKLLAEFDEKHGKQNMPNEELVSN